MQEVEPTNAFPDIDLHALFLLQLPSEILIVLRANECEHASFPKQLLVPMVTFPDISSLDACPEQLSMPMDTKPLMFVHALQP